jgi:hypothetical protein
MSESEKSSLMLFLSVDLVGSTRLKNRLNHQTSLQSFESRMAVRNKFPNAGASETEWVRAVLDSMSEESPDRDWATVVGKFYDEFHGQFTRDLGETLSKYLSDKTNARVGDGVSREGAFDSGRILWKAVGDELIYRFSIKSRLELHAIVWAFLSSLRKNDGKPVVRRGRGGRTSEKDVGPRVKGAAWVAGFPVRNRHILVPGSLQLVDFLGPDMDTGFRVAKCTRAGMLVVSTELAELLGEARPHSRLCAKIVGWERLKGVWEDHPYPVIWVDFPKAAFEQTGELEAVAAANWERAEEPLCKAWHSNDDPLEDIQALRKHLQALREALPSSLGLIKPYIVGDMSVNGEVDTPPGEHQRILQMLEYIQSYETESDQYSRPAETPSKANPLANKDKILDNVILDEETDGT